MSSSFSFLRLTTTTDDLEGLYKENGVDRAVVLDLADATETLETVQGGYYGAYLSFFHSCGILLRSSVRAREEGLSFGIDEFRHLVMVKQNTQSPSTILVSPRPGRHVIKDVPYRDEKWREQFFVFRVDRASVGDFDFSRLPRSWAERIAPFEGSLMSDEIHGLIGVLRRGRLDWSSFDQARILAVFARPEGTNMAPLVGDSEDEAEHSQENRASGKSTLITIHDSDDEGASEERRSPASLSPCLGDETVSATRKQHRSSKDTLPGPSRSRSAGCCLPSLASSAEKEAYAKVAVASSKVTEAFNEYVIMMEDHIVASQNDKEIESIGSEIKRLSGELEAARREGKKDAENIEALNEG
ncbi:hypothetical protein DY000_02050096 [Brassica cretica]|uniref:Uncharacterized protein n=1 Tax=Brassica cretica TaxID=69181 RepID=A0ABQ7F2E6_BRACR|nr:hypothetical protein DY000_02050096 [Brassica cretica]